MTTFTTSKASGLIVSVPEGSGFYSTETTGLNGVPLFSYDPDINTIEGAWRNIPLPFPCTFLGLSHELSVRQKESIVYSTYSTVFMCHRFQDYQHSNKDFATASESFTSLLLSLGLDPKEPFAILIHDKK